MIAGVYPTAQRAEHECAETLCSAWTAERGDTVEIDEPRLFLRAGGGAGHGWQFGALRESVAGGFAARLLEPAKHQTSSGRDFPELVDRLGADVVQQANGAFAAAWVEPEGLVLVRDQFGQVPLYWRRVADQVVFSSVLTDLVQMNPEPVVDEAALSLAGSPGFVELGDRTALIGVHQVLPGTAVMIGAQGHRVISAWSPGLITADPSPTTVADLDRALQAAVADSLTVGDRIASHFSGGVDSTLIAFLAQDRLRAKQDNLACLFSWTPVLPPGAQPVESLVLKRLADQLGVPVWFGPWDVLPGFDERDRAREPRADLYREHLCVREAQRRGISVVLSGWGGDDFASFGGRHYAENLFRRGRWVAAVRQVVGEQRHRGRFGPRLWLRATGSAAKRMRAAYTDGPYRRDNGTPEGRISRRAALRYWRAETAQDIMTALWAWGHLPRRIGSFWEEGRRHGVEYRYPMLDLRVVDTAMRIPEADFCPGGAKRAPIKDIASRHVGSAWARTAGKTDAELNRWMRERASRT